MSPHRIRKLTRSPGHADALHWPVNVLLIVFGGFVLGVALAYQRFDDPIWYRSAWTAVVAIPIFVATGILVARLLSYRWMRRSMQLGMLVSLVVHLLLVLATLHVVLPRKPWDRPAPRDVVPSQNAPLLAEKLQIELALGDSSSENPLPPIEAPPPVPDNRPMERIPADRSPLAPQPLPVDEPQPTPRPDVVRRADHLEPEVRRSPTPSRLSSNRQSQEPLSRQVVEAVVLPRLDEPAHAAQPAELSVARSKNTGAVALPPSADRELVPEGRAAEALRLARAADDVPESQSPVMLRRQPTSARGEPSLATDVQPQPAQWSTQPPVLAPAPTKVTKQPDRFASGGRPELNSEAGAETAPQIELRRNDLSDAAAVSQVWVPRPERRPLPVERTRSDLPDAADDVFAPAENSPVTTASSAQLAASAMSQAVAKQEQAARPAVPPPSSAEDEPARAELPSIHRVAFPEDVPQTTARHSLARPSRSVRVDDQGELASAVAAASASPVDAATAVRPTDTTLAQQAHPGDQMPARQPTEELQLSPTNELANRVFRRSLVADQATVLPFERPSPSPARGATAAAPQTTVAIDSPAAQPGADTVVTPGQPAPLALSKGSTGVVGAGYSMNLDRAAPAADSPALAASGASLPKATQRDDPGPALRPAVAALVPRAQAGGALPQSAMAVEPSTGSEAAVDVAAAGPTQSAAAARVTLASQAERGQITADQGHLEVDLGPQRTMAQLQSGRGSGGGRERLTPSLSHVVAPTRNSTAQMTIRTETIASVVAAPPGQGGSRPPAIDAAPTAVAAARTDAGGNTPITGQPSEAAMEGPPSELNAADVLGQLSLRTAASVADARRSVGETDAAGQLATERAVLAPSRVTERSVPSSYELPTASDASRRDGAVADNSARTPASPAEPTGTASSLELAPVAQTVVVNRDRSQVRSQLGSVHSSLTESNAASESPPLEFNPPPRMRSLSADAPKGPTLSGGGNQMPRGPARSRQIAPDTRGLPSVEQVVWNATMEPTEPVRPSTSGSEIQRRTGGLAARVDEAVPMPDQLNASLTPGAVTVRAARSAPDVPPADHRVVAAVSGQRNASAVPSTVLAPEEAMRPVAGGSSAPGSPADTVAAVAQVARRSTDLVQVALPVEADLSPGDGGLGVLPARDAGVVDRRARPDAPSIQTQVARIPRREPGGLPATNAAPVVAAEAFRKRVERNQLGGGDRLGPETERAIELGLAYLARHQLQDGRWSLHGLDSTAPAMNSDVAATGLALLAFQGAGYTHREHQYRDVVRRGLDFLLASQQSGGLIYYESDAESNRVTRLYSHAIAALALCEAYGMTQDPALREPCQKALDYIVASQSRELGGWRYTPQVSSDTSVSGWMLMALKSGELAGLSVPKETYQLVVRWLDRAQGDQPHLYRYNPDAPDTPAQRHGRIPSPTMTSVGLLMRLYTGWRRDHPAMQAGGAYLRENLPGMSDLADPVVSRRRDTYYWYYATQVMFHLGGDYWRVWNGQLHPLLVRSQILTGPDAGSWDPLRPVPDRWAAHAGRLYVTTMNLLSLEVPYRHLPLYESTAR